MDKQEPWNKKHDVSWLDRFEEFDHYMERNTTQEYPSEQIKREVEEIVREVNTIPTENLCEYHIIPIEELK
jgi:hypothetical protein